MTIVKTDLGNTRESARRLRVEPVGSLTATNVQKALEQLGAYIPPSTAIRVVTAAGAITVLTTDVYVGVNKTVGAATTVNLPAASSWAGNGQALDLVVKDLKADAFTNNITIVPNGVETIDGLAQWLINQDLGAVRLRPLADGTGWYLK